MLQRNCEVLCFVLFGQVACRAGAAVRAVEGSGARARGGPPDFSQAGVDSRVRVYRPTRLSSEDTNGNKHRLCFMSIFL